MTYFRFKPSTALVVAMASMAASVAGPANAAELTTYATLSDTRPGNITIPPDGRVIITQQPLDAPALRVVEILPDGSKVPFPTQDWSDGPDIGDMGIAGTIGIETDSAGIVWILDMGSETSPAKFVAWNTVTDELHKIIELPGDGSRSCLDAS